MGREDLGEYLTMVAEVREVREEIDPGAVDPPLEDLRFREVPLAGLAVLEARESGSGERRVYNFEAERWERFGEDLERFLERCEGAGPGDPGSMLGP